MDHPVRTGGTFYVIFGRRRSLANCALRFAIGRASSTVLRRLSPQRFFYAV